MSNNSLSGKIPQCLINVNRDLRLLDLSTNRFRGPLPEILASKYCSLKSIVLRHNHLRGKLPPSWASCKQLEALDLSDNELEDSFPGWLETLPNFVLFPTQYIDSFNNMMGGGKGLGTLQYVMNGSFAFQSASVIYKGVQMELRKLQKAFVLIDLSREIPAALANLTSLAIFNVSMNRLTGKIPHSKQFDTFGSDSFDGNPDLCGAPLTKPCTSTGGH
ncbi:receptor like protein 23-like [Punica granatum]|uniref:Receptor like protein 23-like n=1 Tax=Punica granatum TaxID=22663 RepID=A0A6P8CA64_PUNGR|nr:receptor like protein 23-like [Punica granatum]